MNEVYTEAFTEVDEILKNIDANLLEKIPQQLRELITETKSDSYKFEYNKNVGIDEQEIKPQTKAIISLLYRNYWCTPEEKERLMQEERDELLRIEKEKLEKYNADNIFKTKDPEPVKEEQQEMIVAEKESFWKKIINKIKKVFGK